MFCLVIVILIFASLCNVDAAKLKGHNDRLYSSKIHDSFLFLIIFCRTSQNNKFIAVFWNTFRYKTNFENKISNVSNTSKYFRIKETTWKIIYPTVTNVFKRPSCFSFASVLAMNMIYPTFGLVMLLFQCYYECNHMPALFFESNFELMSSAPVAIFNATSKIKVKYLWMTSKEENP